MPTIKVKRYVRKKFYNAPYLDFNHDKQHASENMLVKIVSRDQHTIVVMAYRQFETTWSMHYQALRKILWL